MADPPNARRRRHERKQEGRTLMQDDESPVSHRRLAYLPALDGVRAFAVIAVMMFHGGLSFMNGGFMGVDVFFVLSGFLITSLLVGEWRESLTIRLGAFWARRARRLLPALLLMLLFVAFFAAVIVPKGTYGSLRLDALSTLLYVSNWHFILVDTNYFNETAAASPLLHTWSLAVEEQFYLVWPLVVLGLLHLTRNLRALFWLCVAAAVASALWMWHLYDPTSVNRVYLGTDTRSQCLFIGCALAVGLVLLTQHEHAEGRLRLGELWRPAGAAGRTLCSTAGIVGAAAAIVIWVSTNENDAFPYRGGFFLIGLATAGVILSAVGAPRSLVPRFLSLPPIRYVGQISYGLYIWHWPLFIWLDHARTGLSGYPLFFVRVLVTFAVSVASFHLVERPIRHGTFIRQWKAWVAVPAGVVVVVAALMAATTGTSALASTAQPGQVGATGGGGTSTTTTTTRPGSAPGAPPVRVLLFGDSVALTLGYGLAVPSVQQKYDYVLSSKAILGCGVVNGPEVQLLGATDGTAPACNGSPLVPGTPLDKQPWPDQWTTALNVVQPNVGVLLAGRWEVVNREYEGQWTNILHPQFAAYVKSQLEEASQLVTASGARMVFLTAPCTDEGEQPDGAPWPEDNPARLAEYNKLVRQVAAEHPQTDSVVNLYAAVCPGGKFTQTIHGVAVRQSDGVHFTYVAGEVLAPDIMPEIVAAGRAQMAQAAQAATPTSVPPPSVTSTTLP
jgi:peptidoglycan/LPS O-acetylase OafA/YrhL